MRRLRVYLYRLLEEKYNNEYETNELIICSICGKSINIRQAYIKDEDFKIFCSKACYLKYLNSKYY